MLKRGEPPDSLGGHRLEKDRALELLEGMWDRMVEDSRAIWGYAEEALMEFRSSELLMERLRGHGFEVEGGAGGMETAFVGSWGSGSPVVGIIAEYDAPGSRAPTRRWR